MIDDFLNPMWQAQEEQRAIKQSVPKITVKPNKNAFGDNNNYDPFRGFNPPKEGIKVKIHKRHGNNN